jgi:hypothetical protein
MGGVLDQWGFGNSSLGRRQWAKTLRVAVRDYKEPPLGAKALLKLRPELNSLIKKHGIKAVAVIEAPPPGRGQKKKNNAWNLLGFPGNPYKWAGTVHRRPDGVFVCPILNYYGHEYVYSWLARRQLIQALEVAKGRVRPMEWPTLLYTPNQDMLDALIQLQVSSEELVIDIETNLAHTIFTAIGVGNSEIGISVPWDSFQISATDRYEPGIDDYAIGAEIKTCLLDLLASNIPKVGHNFAFDIYQLREKGIPVGGEIHDTLDMSHSIFNQFDKSLQLSCAIVMTTEPWKSLHKPPKPKKKSVNFDPWMATPEETRVYNCKDVVATGRLFRALLKGLA